MICIQTYKLNEHIFFIKLISLFFFLCSFYAFRMPIYGLEKCDSIILDAGMNNPSTLFYFLVFLKYEVDSKSVLPSYFDI